MAKKKKKLKTPDNPVESGASAVESKDAAAAVETKSPVTASGEFDWRVLAREPVAIGLGLMMLYRPWKDGMTYMSFNVYFMLWITMLSGGYLLWKLKKREALRFPAPTALFGGFVLISYLTALGGVDYSISLQHVLLLISYYLLFVLASDGVRTRLGIGIVVGAVVLTSLVNAVWAVVHTQFVLPHVRESIIANPRMLQVFFNVDQLTPELKNRLEMQRAFGTFLQPNSLGGYLALCIPVMLMWGLASIPGMRRAAEAMKPESGRLNSNFATLLVGALSGFWMLVYMYGLNALLEGHTDGAVQLIHGTARSLFFYAGLPIAFGLVSGYLTHLKGTLGFGRILATLLLFLTVLVQAYSMWLTFSRGAMLGLAVGCALGGVLLVLSLRQIPGLGRFSSGWAEFAAASIVAGSLIFVPASQALELTHDGFQVPDTVFDYRPQSITYDTADLAVEGREVGVTEIASGKSLSFRLSYWSVGMLIVKDNFFTGVGPGNFGTVYGYYQYLDAHDVKTAHNDFLQVLAETGIVGFVLFMGFWIYTLVWGGGQIMRERSWVDRLALVGMFAGISGFLAHTFFDFNFQNASLAMTMFVFTGLFFSLAVLGGNAGSDTSEPSKKAGIAAVPACVALLLLVCFSLYADIRQFRYDFGRTFGTTSERLYNIGSGLYVSQPLRMLESILSPEVLNPPAVPPPNWQPVYHAAAELRFLITDDADLYKLGVVQIPLGGGGQRRANPGEALPDNAAVILNSPEQARAIGLKYGAPMLAEFERLEAIYPHGTEVPGFAYRWVKALAGATQDKGTRQRYGELCLVWSKRRADRSPFDPEAQIEYCGGMWERGKVESSVKQLDYYRAGIAQYKEGLKLYPTSHSMYRQFGESMDQIGDAFIAAGKIGRDQGNPLGQQLIDEGQGFKREGAAASERAKYLARYKHDVLQLR